MLVTIVIFHPEFEREFEELAAEVKVELLAQLKVVEKFGPLTGRPRVDTLNGSRYPNMKDLRFSAGGGEWRFAFAFDPVRRAALLCGDDKSGQSQATFYRRLIARADRRFEVHLEAIGARTAKEKKKKGRRGR